MIFNSITYLLFLRRLDDMHTLEENKANRLKKPMERRVSPEGSDPKGRPYEDLRWSRFKHFAPGDIYAVLAEHAFPFLRTLGGDDSTYAHHMKDARFTIPTPALLAKVVDLLDKLRTICTLPELIKPERPGSPKLDELCHLVEDLCRDSDRSVTVCCRTDAVAERARRATRRFAQRWLRHPCGGCRSRTRKPGRSGWKYLHGCDQYTSRRYRCN